MGAGSKRVRHGCWANGGRLGMPWRWMEGGGGQVVEGGGRSKDGDGWTEVTDSVNINSADNDDGEDEDN